MFIKSSKSFKDQITFKIIMDIVQLQSLKSIYIF